MKRPPIYALFICLLLGSCNNNEDVKAGWQKVYAHDQHGSSTYGNKQDLIDAVRLGYPVRLGFGGSRVEHVAEASFLTILDGEVFGQISSIIGQNPQIENDSIKLRFRLDNKWTKIAGTNGYSTSFMTDYTQDTIVGGGTDRYRSATWYVDYPLVTPEIEARPLWRDVSPLWEEWEATTDKKSES